MAYTDINAHCGRQEEGICSGMLKSNPDMGSPGGDRFGESENCSVRRLLAVIQKYVLVDRTQYVAFKLVNMFFGSSITLVNRGCLILVAAIHR